MAFTRNCPDCGKVLHYSRKDSLRRAIKNKFVCRSCAYKGKIFSEEHKQKLSKNHVKYWLGKTRSEETKQKIGESLKGRTPWNVGIPHPEEVRKKMGRDVSGEKNPMYHKIHSEETKRKMRLAAIARIEQNHGQVQPNYNPDACKLIEECGKQHGYNFQHAENGGEFHIKELGYWVDGYDVKQNVVIEIDEFRHFKNGKFGKKDVERQQEIVEHLGCDFIRIRI